MAEAVAEAEAGPEASASGYEVECEKEVKEVCRPVPVATPVEKEVEICTGKPKEVNRTNSTGLIRHKYSPWSIYQYNDDDILKCQYIFCFL